MAKIFCPAETYFLGLIYFFCLVKIIFQMFITKTWCLPDVYIPTVGTTFFI